MVEDLFRVAVTAIIKRHDERILITKRSSSKKRWPNKWTVPGGGLQKEDFIGKPTDVNNQWYHVLENAVLREVKEETGLNIRNIKYLCNIAIPDCIILSYTAELFDHYDQPSLQTEECDQYAWVTADEAEKYDLIDGLLDEIKLACSN
jgi:8-oxo-dGTP pyrophosphatase MutT (NUDIX family)